MLQCNMNAATSLQLVLDDLLADMRHARRQGDLGRLALLAYCEVRRWARDAGETALAEHASRMVTGGPYASRGAFLADVDAMIHELEQRLKPLPALGAFAAGRLADVDGAKNERPLLAPR